jgi:hypothetical protein
VTYYGQGKAALLREAVHERLRMHESAEELPTNNRFILYELRQYGGPLYGWSSRAQGRSEDQNLSDASKWLRDHGHVPWLWIADETRSVTAYRYAATVLDYLADTIDEARINCWGGELPPLIICESRTFGGVLARTIAPEYLCPVIPTNGQVGGFLHTNVVPWLAGNERRVLYVGDLDLAGRDIEGNTQRVLEGEAGEREWMRVALTEEQVAAHDLPTVEKVDRRFRPHRRQEAVEVEALGQGVVTEIIRAAPTPCSRSRSRTYRYARRSSGGGSPASSPASRRGRRSRERASTPGRAPEATGKPLDEDRLPRAWARVQSGRCRLPRVPGDHPPRLLAPAGPRRGVPGAPRRLDLLRSLRRSGTP